MCIRDSSTTKLQYRHDSPPRKRLRLLARGCPAPASPSSERCVASSWVQSRCGPRSGVRRATS
eukprot:5436287-Alexandrium_andersonii.AAC.1